MNLNLDWMADAWPGPDRDLSYDAWPSGEPYEWPDGNRGHRIDDQHDFHVDLGCGKLKKGRIGIDRYPAPGVNIVADLDELVTYSVAERPGEDAEDPRDKTAREQGFEWSPGMQVRIMGLGLPFADSSVESMISHHCLEHIGPGFIALMDECYRVLKPGAPFRIIVPLFPSTTAVEDPDHKRWFMEGTFDSFCGFPDHHWAESFSVPYTKARFEKTDQDQTALFLPHERWTDIDRRELRVTLRPRK